MITQNNQILAIMESGRWITPLEALEECGCMRLGARIKDLRDLGYDIEDEWVTMTKTNGEKKRFKKYRLRRTA